LAYSSELLDENAKAGHALCFWLAKLLTLNTQMTMQPPSPILAPSFLLLTQEGHLISRCLTTGLTELRTANVHNVGAFYAALLNLSVGTERLMKASIIIDHMLKNGLSVPTSRELKAYGHDLIRLYESCANISKLEAHQVPEFTTLEEISRELLVLLCDFASTTRYHNLDTLSATSRHKDPLAHWNDILRAILETDVTENRKAKIIANASATLSSISDRTFTLMQGLDQQALSTEQALTLPGLHAEAAKHAVLHIVKLLWPLRKLISDLSRKAYLIGETNPPFPQMQEFLYWLYDDRAYVLKKKRWP